MHYCFFYLMTLRYCLLHRMKLTCLLKCLLRSQILITQGISLPFFPSRTNLKLPNIPVTPSLNKTVRIDIDSSKVPGFDCILVVVLKNCEPEPSYILAKFFSICLKEFCFPDCWMASSVVPVCKNVGRLYG